MAKFFSRAAIVAVLVLIAVSSAPEAAPKSALAIHDEQTKAGDAATFTASGRTQCAPGRKCIIAPVPLHPVVEVLVAAGDRVKKEQVLVKLDDDEPKADVRNKKAIMDGAKVAHKEAERYFKRIQESYKHSAIPESSYFAALTADLKAAQDTIAAEAAWESAKAELEHYEVVSFIDGVIAWLEVYPGMVSRPGTSVWGEILDLSEIDVRCEITIDQADTVKKDQTVKIARQTKNNGPELSGKVVMVGLTVDRATSLVPVIVRVPNAAAVLRCGESVQVRFEN